MRDDFTFYYGAANGSAQKALRELGEPNVMISYQTRNNRPWEGIESLFIDSGGYSLMLAEGEHDWPDEYLDYLERVDADLFAIQDYPCEPEILKKYDRTVQYQQELTVEAACHVLTWAEDRGIDAEPLTVVQGWEPREYAHHVDRLREEGALTEYVGIGSVCRRGATEEIREIIRTVDRATPPGTKLHAFGVKADLLQYEDVRQALASADSTAYDFRMGKTVLPRWQEVAREYLNYKRSLTQVLEGEQVEAGPNATLTQALAVTDGGTVGEVSCSGGGQDE